MRFCKLCCLPLWQMSKLYHTEPLETACGHDGYTCESSAGEPRAYLATDTICPPRSSEARREKKETKKWWWLQQVPEAYPVRVASLKKLFQYLDAVVVYL